jgi:hypothetical protein
MDMGNSNLGNRERNTRLAGGLGSLIRNRGSMIIFGKQI